MLTYRNLCENDCDFILQNWVGHSVVFSDGLRKNDLLAMIAAMNTKKHNGNYYEMFGILSEGILVGTFSFYQQEQNIQESAVYLGIEIAKGSRGRGLATNTAHIAVEIAREKGFAKILSQARVSNTASVKLHKKCGFEIVDKAVSANGHEVYNYVRWLYE